MRFIEDRDAEELGQQHHVDFFALGGLLDKARHKEKEIEVLNEREAVAVALETIAEYFETGPHPQPEPTEAKPKAKK